MNFIPTTATAAEKLKRLAKQQRKASGTSLGVALESVAHAHGYSSWKHVTECLEQSKRLPGARPALPAVLAAYLRELNARQPVSDIDQEAFRHGLVFAMDVKDVDGVALGAELAECDDVWPLAASDLWNQFVHAKDHEDGVALVDKLPPSDLLTAAQEELTNYRLFRYTGSDVPSSLEMAFRNVFGQFFFAPRMVWMKGTFIDMEEAREVQVAGHSVYSSRPNTRTESSTSSRPKPDTGTDSAGSDDRPPSSASELAPEPKRGQGFIPRLDIMRMQPGLYEYRLTHQGQAMLSGAGLASIREAIEEAADITGDILGFEVGYAGVTVGTFPLDELQASAEAIAHRAVQTASLFGAH
ncbi:hypothetical protein [Paucibacter sp. M5-1]|uniref:hypothetical protein n=1 Tax=Paucibacter sp. M5-1 TaxID=3015998 RepID=UPI0022B86B68|nr:hypothetical protein [Paucibacter sp. M5-1]MCZ7881930.1 hypothetical protein [Paucibacter sp. M5-1]